MHHHTHSASWVLCSLAERCTSPAHGVGLQHPSSLVYCSLCFAVVTALQSAVPVQRMASALPPQKHSLVGLCGGASVQRWRAGAPLSWYYRNISRIHYKRLVRDTLGGGTSAVALPRVQFRGVHFSAPTSAQPLPRHSTRVLNCWIKVKNV
jgi:hypothetical protein